MVREIFSFKPPHTCGHTQQLVLRIPDGCREPRHSRAIYTHTRSHRRTFNGKARAVFQDASVLGSTVFKVTALICQYWFPVTMERW
jgi:hypothetical protein